MRKIVKTNKELEVRKSEHLVNARYTLNPLAIKFLTTIIANIKKEDDVDKEYIFKLKEFKELLGIKGNSIYKYVEIALEELLKNPLKIPLKNNEKGKPKFLKVSWISSAIYDDGEISFLIDKRLKPFLIEVKEKYLKYKLENILSLRSSYSIKLYEILKDNFNQNNRYNKIAELKISVEDFKEELEIPNSYRFNNIKIQILEKAKKELEEYTDIIFEYEEIKKGRKVIEIKFTIYKNPAKTNGEPKVLQENKKQILEVKKSKKVLEVKETNYKITNNWNDWRKEFLKKGNLIILFENEKFEVKNNYLWQNKELLSKEKSLGIWQNLYENRDKLQVINEDEYMQEQIKKAEEQENKYKKLDEIRKKYDDKTIFGQPNKDKPINKYTITTIQYRNDNKIEVYFEEDYTKERSITLFPNTNTLEDFLKVTYQAYLQNKENENNKIEVNENENENEKLLNRVKELKSKYINVKLLIEIDDDENLEAEVINLKIDNNDIGLYINIKGDGETIESFELNTDEVNRLEKFLITCNKAYLKTHKNDLKSKLSSFMKKF